MKLIWDRKSIFNKLLIYVTIIISFLLVMLSSILFYVYSSSAKDTIYDLNAKILSQISYSSNYIDNLAKNYCKSVYFNNNIVSLMYDKNLDILNAVKAIRTIDVTAVPDSYVHSVYIYNANQDLFISNINGNIDNSGDFFDKEVVSIVKDSTAGQFRTNTLFARRTPNFSNYGDKKHQNYDYVYTYIIRDFSDTSHKVNGAVVLNVKADWLRNTISALDSKSNYKSNIFVINEDGIVVSHSSSEMFLKNISNEDYVKQILSSGKNSDSFIKSINGIKYVVTFVSSDALKWKFVSLTPYGSVISPVRKVQAVAFAFCMIILLLGLVLSFMLSKKIYSPIGSLVSNVNKKMNLNNKNEKDVDEMKFLSSAFSNMIDKSNELDEIKRSGSQSVKNEYLKSILLNEGTISSHEYMFNKLNHSSLNICLDNSALFLLLLRIDNYKDFINKYNENDRLLCKFAVTNITNELVSKHFNNEVVDMGNDYFSVILNITEDNFVNNNVYNTLNPIVQKIQENVYKFFNFSLSATYGYIINSKDTLSIMYKNTVSLSMYRIIYGHSSIITPSVVDEINTDEFKYPVSKEKILLDSLKLGNLERATQAYNDIISIISGYSYENIIASVIYLSFNIYNTLNAVLENCSVNISSVLNSFLTDIGSFETLEEINQTFISLFKDIVGVLGNSKTQKTNSLANNVMSLINEKYSNKNLCLNSIADSLALSPIYIRRIFKEATNKSVAEYITDVRMQKVKSLLDSGNTNINNILESAGLEKSNYFYTTFRKYFGIPLSAYRLEAAAKETDNNNH
jgi:two-component system, response regulator YesN